MSDEGESGGFANLKRSANRDLLRAGTTTQERALDDGVLTNEPRLPGPSEIRVWRLPELRMPKNIFNTRMSRE
jgi:hypothetical protein